LNTELFSVIRLKKLFFLALLFFINELSKASVPVVLNDSRQDYFLDFDKVDILEDKNREWTIDQIASSAFSGKFQTNKLKFAINENPNSVYWIRFTLHNNSDSKTNWLIECYNSKIGELTLYARDGNIFDVQTNSARYRFDQRNFNHKNFEFLLPSHLKGPKTYYIKFDNQYKTRAVLLVRAYSRFISYALTEYFFLGLFYGMVVIIVLYNLFLYFTIKDNAYIYYVFYIISFGLFAMCQDGTGFQYLWPTHSSWNYYSIPFSQWMMITWLMMYSRAFLNVDIIIPQIGRLMNILIIVRTLVFILSITYYPELTDYLYLDLIPFLFAYIAAIVSYSKGYVAARYFVIGFTILFIAFFVNNLRNMRILAPVILAVYSLNIGAIIEMILLSFALADRIKQIRQSDLLKGKINKDLEAKVKERTEAILHQKNIIQEKINEHDNFLYKISHDIKGPLKSIIGLTNVGMMDDKENSKQYFEHIMKSAKRLDTIVMELLFITKVNRATVERSEIDFKAVIAEVLSSLEHVPNYNGMRFEVSIDQSAKYYCERFIMYSVFQNLIENAIKYRRRNISDSFLKINISCNDKEARIDFIDNGIGMDQEYHSKVFDMFFKIHSDKESTGLGLYIVKISVEKLGGAIRIESESEKGTSFFIKIKNTEEKVGAE
jgi:two-component system, sensor histidine kinase LadS